MSTDSDVIRESLRAPERFAEIFERHAACVEAFVASRVGAAAKDDILSETFLAAFRVRRRFDLSKESARPWLLGIAVRMIRRHRSAEAAHWRAWAAGAGSAELSTADEVQCAGDRVDATAAVRELAPVIAGLSQRDRDTLLLYAWGDLTYEQVAAALRVPVGTVRSRLNRIRSRLASPPRPARVLAERTDERKRDDGYLRQGA
ncbi:sigma-70 family RNA polymerase sigma factor [Leifsonia sp. C5G2]|uniref:RNA polymerase sigma factor n=1 Tax=Leifsonia sp. C5G2 TaxID=2735269 RepID=UPI0032DE947C